HHVQREHTEEVTVHALVVERRVRAVITQVLAGHFRVAGEPAGVVIQALPRTGRPGRLCPATSHETIAATARGQLLHRYRNIGHHPVHEVGTRLPDGHAHVVPANGLGHG